MAPQFSRILPAVRRRSARWLSIIRLLPLAGGPLLCAALLLNTLIGLLPTAFIVLTSVMLSRLPEAAAITETGRPWSVLGPALALAVTAFVLQQLLAPFQTALGEVVSRRIDGACIQRLMTASLATPLSVLERSDVLDTLNDARTGFDRALPTPGDAAAGALALIARYGQLAGAVVLLGVVLDPLIALLVGVVALVIRFGQRGSLGRFAALWGSLAPARRKVTYLRELASGTSAAKEIRVLGLLSWLRDRHTTDTRGYLDPLWAGRRRILGPPFVGYALVGLVGGGIALVFLARTAAGGELSLLALSLSIQAILIPMRFGVFFPESDVQTQYGLQAYDAIRSFEKAAQDTDEPRPAAETDETRPAGHAASTAPPVPAAAGAPKEMIRFEKVSFSYGNSDRPVLDGLDLELPIGKSTAIVGLNGAGKTTIVKLLAKLYRPTDGRITVDGRDLALIGERDWQRHLAVIFQDYVRYELSAADNIGLSRPARLADRAAITAAAERAGATEVVAGLPDGLDTPLSRLYRGGRDLSGGQWQRIALARAMFAVASGASLLVLDEPTAQLDVRAEVAFYDRFLELTRGLTTVLISHRFSSVRRADRIVVIADGRVQESGTHEELMAMNGRYAELFRLQAERFAAEAETDAREDVTDLAEDLA